MIHLPFKFKENNDFTQFVKLFKDQNQSQLFGWLNTYPDTNRPDTVVEQWALSSRQDLNLYGSAYYLVNQEPPPPVPSNYEEWVKEIKHGPSFEAYIHRQASVCPYNAFDPSQQKKWAYKTGHSAMGIYNSATRYGAKSLVMVTLQTAAEPIPGTKGKRFEQISIMTTLEAPEPWFIYTEEIIQTSPLTFAQFVEDGGINDLQFTRDQLQTALIEFEVVYSIPHPPPVLFVPEDLWG